MVTYNITEFSNKINSDLNKRLQKVKERINNFAHTSAVFLVDSNPTTTGNSVSAWAISYSTPVYEEGMYSQFSHKFYMDLNRYMHNFAPENARQMLRYYSNQMENNNILESRKLTDTIYITNNAKVDDGKYYTKKIFSSGGYGIENNNTSLKEVNNVITTLSKRVFEKGNK